MIYKILCTHTVIFSKEEILPLYNNVLIMLSFSKSLKTKKEHLNLKTTKTFDQLLLPSCWENLILSIQNYHDLKLSDRMNSVVQQSYHLEEHLKMLHQFK